MSRAEVKKRFACIRTLTFPSLRGLTLFLAVLPFSEIALGASAESDLCPPLGQYYPANTPATVQQWSASLAQLEPLSSSCLRSAEFFALLGAAQMNTGQVSQAMESLERALLLDPANGAAQIDYSEALFLAGQLLPALEINARLLQRQDLPANMKPVLEARQNAWQRMTYHRQFLLEATAGHDSNLNGAPTRRDLTLTLNGTPIALTLDEQYQPLEGFFTNLRLGADWHKTQPGQSHDLLISGRARLSSEGDTDLGQLDWRYTFAKSIRRHRWELGGGTSHLTFGGNPLYTVTELRARYSRLRAGCQPTIEGVTQHLLYHGQTLMNGVEGSITGGLGCAMGNQQWLVEGGYLNNQPTHGSRPGGARKGWQLRMSWQWIDGLNQLNAQLSHTDLEDDRSYSPLLENGAIRNVENSYIALRYKRLLSEQFSLLLNVNHQAQDSNLEPFNNRGTVAEAGLSLTF